MIDTIPLRSLTALTIGALAALPLPAHAQSAPADTVAESACPAVIDFALGDLAGHATDFSRTAELVGAAPLRSRLIRRTGDEAQLTVCAPPESVPWRSALRPYTPERAVSFEYVYPRFRATLNSAYPDSRNDGALWAGRGLNTELEGGVTFRHGAISGALLPIFIVQQNGDFETITSVRPAGYAPYIYPWHPGTIDWPLRFGDRAFATFDPGQSYIRLEHRGLALALSTENLWWGPAQRNPLLLSNTAPGFAHLALGTARPLDARFGAVEAQAIWGRLEESPYYDGEVANDARLFAGVIVDVQPYALPGLFLGFARAHVLELDRLALYRQAAAPFWSMGGRNEDGSDHPGYQLLSVFGRWAFPEAGFEAYAEWASRAQWASLSDFLREPGRGQAYVFGFQYVVPTGQRWVRVYGEAVQLAGSPKSPLDGGAISFYTETRIRQGHTHRGQLLGAAIGPGSDAQTLGADLFLPWGRVGLFAERNRRDDDAYYALWTRYYGPSAHDIALTAGVRQLLFLGDYSLGWRLSYESRRNRNFIGVDGFNWDLRTERNWSFNLEAGWRPGASRKPANPSVASARHNRE